MSRSSHSHTNKQEHPSPCFQAEEKVDVYIVRRGVCEKEDDKEDDSP